MAIVKRSSIPDNVTEIANRDDRSKPSIGESRLAIAGETGKSPDNDSHSDRDVALIPFLESQHCGSDGDSPSPQQPIK
jgi:hypothetical protein